MYKARFSLYVVTLYNVKKLNRFDLYVGLLYMYIHIGVLCMFGTMLNHNMGSKLYFIMNSA